MYDRELTLEEVAARLRMKASTLRRWLRRIHFAAIQGGDTLLFTEADYIAVREARRTRPRSTRPAQADPGPSDALISRRLQALRAASSPRSSAKVTEKPKSVTFPPLAKGRVVAFPGKRRVVQFCGKDFFFQIDGTPKPA